MNSILSPPQFTLLNRFTQLDLWANCASIKTGVNPLPKKLDKEVARLHLERIDMKLTKVTKKQADYLGVPVGRLHYGPKSRR